MRYICEGVEFSEEDVARLRALPHSEIGDLRRAGRMAEWYVACGEPLTPVKKAEPTPSPQAHPFRKPRLSPQRRDELEARARKAMAENDFAALRALESEKDFDTLRLDRAGETVDKLPVKSLRAAAFWGLYAHEVSRHWHREHRARLAKLEQRILELETQKGVR